MFFLDPYTILKLNITYGDAVAYVSLVSWFFYSSNRNQLIRLEFSPAAFILRFIVLISGQLPSHINQPPRQIMSSFQLCHTLKIFPAFFNLP